MIMKKYLFCLMVGITLVMACSNEDADGGCYENWSSENKPAWLQDKVNDIVRKESGSRLLLSSIDNECLFLQV